MMTIYADFNALNEDRTLSLETRGSLEDIRRLGVRPGDRVWLSDGEMSVAALIAEDSRRHLIGIPSWETITERPGSGVNSSDEPQEAASGGESAS